MKDIRRYITKPAKLVNNRKVDFNDFGDDLLKFFSYCIYNSFIKQTDITNELYDIVKDGLGFYLSLDDYDASHIADSIGDAIKDENWVRKIVLDCMIDGDYKVDQTSVYAGDDEENGDNEALEEVEALLAQHFISKKRIKAVKDFFKGNGSEGTRYFAIVLESAALEPIYRHKELRELFVRTTSFEFANPYKAYGAWYVFEESYERNMIDMDYVKTYIDSYNKQIRKHRRPQEENLEFAMNLQALSAEKEALDEAYNEASATIDHVLSTYETESQVMF